MGRTFAGIGLLVIGLALFAGAKEKPAKPARDRLRDDLVHVLLKVAEAEPNQVGQYHDLLRGEGNIINGPETPVVLFDYPYNGFNIEDGTGIVIRTTITGWTVDPTKATNAGAEFAIGKAEPGIGHTHIWGYNSVGDRVRFTGATGLQPDGNGYFVSAPFDLPPGEYQFFVQLQNHDHTGPIPSAAQSLPPFDSVYFTVGVPEGDEPDVSMSRFSEMKRLAAAYRPLDAAECN